MTKSFVVVAAIVILVGGSIGGAFTGGVILGRNQAENETPAATNFVPPQDFAGRGAALQQFSNQIPLDEDGNPDFAALRQMAQEQGGGLPTTPGRTSTASTDADSDDSDLETPSSMDNDDDDDAEATESADTQPSFTGFGRGLGPFGGGGATFGTIDSIGEGVVVINTPQGPVEASVGSETAIQVFTDGDLSDLIEGVSVMVIGLEDAESGKLEAVSIIASPEGAGGFPGFGGFQNRPQGAGRGP